MEIVIWGAGQHSKLVIDAVEKSKTHEIRALVDNEKAGSKWFDYDVWSDQQVAESGVRRGIVAIGANLSRRSLVTRVADMFPGFAFVSVIHPAATIARGVEVGEGSFIMAGSILNADATIGPHCIVNTNSTVGHDCELGSFVSVSPGATLCGFVTIGDFSCIGAGATIIQGKKIGERTIIGAGAVVINDIPNLVVAHGIPCKTMSTNSGNEHEQ